MERPENIFEVNAAEEALRSAVDRINPADVKLALDSGANPNISQKNSQDSILNGLVSKPLPAPSDIDSIRLGVEVIFNQKGNVSSIFSLKAAGSNLISKMIWKKPYVMALL